MTETANGLKALREAFPKGTVGVLPKPYKKTSPKGRCDVCGGYHGLPAAHLDFVGHAAVTDRLLSVDPEWYWEPFAVDERGLPALDRDGNLWIRLHVCGVTRIGVGDGPSMKERIGDALRNAAMRFGVALALWTKDELESGYAEEKAVPTGVNDEALKPTGSYRRAPANDATGELASPEQMEKVLSVLNGIADLEQRKLAKQMFVESYGKPDHLLASRYEDALAFATEQAKGRAEPAEFDEEPPADDAKPTGRRTRAVTNEPARTPDEIAAAEAPF